MQALGFSIDRPVQLFQNQHIFIKSDGQIYELKGFNVLFFLKVNFTSTCMDCVKCICNISRLLLDAVLKL